MKIERWTLVSLLGVSVACRVASSGRTDGSPTNVDQEGGQGGQPGQVGAGGVDGAVASGVDGSAIDSPATSADVDLHGGAKRWIEFGRSFVKCTWFTAEQGFCSEKAKSLPGTLNIATDLYQTVTGGRTWTLVATIDGKNSSSASMGVYVLSPTDIWYTTGFLGFGYSGTLGHSTNGGTSFADLTDKAHRVLADDPDAAAPADLPFFDLVRVGSAIWVNAGGQYFAMSPDNGATWQRVLGPLSLADVSAPQFIATKSNLLLFYRTKSFGIALYRLNGSVFLNTEATVPPPSGTDHGDTWWRASVNAEAVTFADRRPWSWWGYPFVVSATLDGGKSFQTVYAGASKAQSGCEGLRDALVVDSVGGSATYVSGVFLDAANNRYDEIRKSTDGGTSWTTLHSERDMWNHTSVSLDPTGKVHATRHTTDVYGNSYDYDAQYVLE